MRESVIKKTLPILPMYFSMLLLFWLDGVCPDVKGRISCLETCAVGSTHTNVVNQPI